MTPLLIITAWLLTGLLGTISSVRSMKKEFPTIYGEYYDVTLMDIFLLLICVLIGPMSFMFYLFSIADNIVVIKSTYPSYKKE